MTYCLYHIMVKNTTLREDKVLKQIQNTFSTYSFGNYIDLARLIQGHAFRYKNRSRLENQFSEEVKQNFDDMKLIIANLSSKHQADILTSKQFNSFVKTWLKVAKTTKEQDYLATLYPSLMKIALNLFPEKIDNFTWREWTKAISDSSGVKGKKLFLSLRQALTGHASGPELANLLPIIGKEKIISRLSGEKS